MEVELKLVFLKYQVVYLGKLSNHWWIVSCVSLQLAVHFHPSVSLFAKTILQVKFPPLTLSRSLFVLYRCFFLKKCASNLLVFYCFHREDSSSTPVTLCRTSPSCGSWIGLSSETPNSWRGNVITTLFHCWLVVKYLWWIPDVLTVFISQKTQMLLHWSPNTSCQSSLYQVWRISAVCSLLYFIFLCCGFSFCISEVNFLCFTSELWGVSGQRREPDSCGWNLLLPVSQKRRLEFLRTEVMLTQFVMFFLTLSLYSLNCRQLLQKAAAGEAGSSPTTRRWRRERGGRGRWRVWEITRWVATVHS